LPICAIAEQAMFEDQESMTPPPAVESQENSQQEEASDLPGGPLPPLPTGPPPPDPPALDDGPRHRPSVADAPLPFLFPLLVQPAAEKADEPDNNDEDEEDEEEEPDDEDEEDEDEEDEDEEDEEEPGEDDDEDEEEADHPLAVEFTSGGMAPSGDCLNHLVCPVDDVAVLNLGKLPRTFEGVAQVVKSKGIAQQLTTKATESTRGTRVLLPDDLIDKSWLGQWPVFLCDWDVRGKKRWYPCIAFKLRRSKLTLCVLDDQHGTMVASECDIKVGSKQLTVMGAAYWAE